MNGPIKFGFWIGSLVGAFDFGLIVGLIIGSFLGIFFCLLSSGLSKK